VITNFAAFLGIAIIVIVTPGQDTALTIRNTLVGGRPAGIATAGGEVSGLATWTVASSAGLAALIVASQPVFLAIRLVGAAYLVFLGLQALYAAVTDRGGPLHSGGGLAAPSGRLSRVTAYRQGLFSNLSNPKIVVFFLSLLPQFVRPGSNSLLSLLLLGALFCSIVLVWLSLYAVVVSRIGDVIRRTGVRRTIEAVSGIVLVGLGFRLATSSR
jgi:threonine/homoserine/homoserine lactone efflux protein